VLPAGAANASVAACEHWTADDLPVYASSSDPIFLPTENADGIPLSQIYLRPIESGDKQNDELEDETSCLSRSVRAFGQSMVSTSEAFVTTRDSRRDSSTSRQLAEEEDPSDNGSRRESPRREEAGQQGHMATSNASYAQESGGPDASCTARVRSLDKNNSSSSPPSANSTVTTRKMYFYRTSRIQSQKVEKFCLLAAPSSRELGADIAHLLGVPVSTMDVGTYDLDVVALQVL
jgi:hypothetical protein